MWSMNSVSVAETVKVKYLTLTKTDVYWDKLGARTVLVYFKSSYQIKANYKKFKSLSKETNYVY